MENDSATTSTTTSSTTTSSTSSTPTMINITQLAPWLMAATAKGNKGFLLKPNDLRMLYLFVLWEYVSKRGDPTSEIPKINSDEEIAIPEADLIRMVQTVFNNTYYPYFNRVFNM